MAKDSFTWTRICSDYRAVAHLVEGLAALIFRLCSLVLYWFNVYDIFIFLYVILEITKGLFLLKGIIEEKQVLVKLYMILSVLTLMVKKGFGIYSLHRNITNSFHPALTGTFLGVIYVLYFLYEWFFFYFVYKLYVKLSGNAARKEGAQQEMLSQ